jgi:hypothetical protein
VDDGGTILGSALRDRETLIRRASTDLPIALSPLHPARNMDKAVMRNADTSDESGVENCF